MKETFKSKVGLVTIIPMCLIGVAFVFVVLVKVWAAVVVMGFVGALTLHMFFNTYYIIQGNELEVRCSFFINKTIDINTITKITPTNNMLSSPALSLDRLEVFYNKYDSVIISPGDKAGFIAKLKSLNEGIEMV